MRTDTLTAIGAAISILASSGVLGSDYWHTGASHSIPSNIVYSGSSLSYEAETTISNQGQLEYRSGSSGVLTAGTQINLNPGFKAYDGSTVWGIIDANFNGISDYLESVDLDGDGYFDALEDYMGTDPEVDSTTYAIDVDSDGILDKVIDVSHGGTPSSFIPSNPYPYFDGYNELLQSAYNPYGTFTSVTVYTSSGLLGGFLPSLSEYFDLSFGITYNYVNFQGWEHEIWFYRYSGKRYQLFTRSYNGPWVALSNVITGSSGWETLYSTNLVDFLWQLPQFVKLVELGEDSSLVGSTISGTFLGLGGTEILQKVKPKGVSLINGDVIELELPIDITGSGGSDIAIAVSFPSGESPTIANIEILGIEIGVTASGDIAVEFPVSIMGAVSDYEFGIVWILKDPTMKFQVIDPGTGNFVDTNQLAVGLWENAFDSSDNLKDDFIDHDIDRFYASITDNSKDGAGQIYANLSSINIDPDYDDDVDKILLIEEPANSGHFRSEAMLLTADSEDDKEKVKAKSTASGTPAKRTDNSDYDRSHKAKFESQLHLEYPISGSSNTEVAAVPFTKSVRVNIVNFKGSTATRSEISHYWSEVAERYAQVGVKVEWILKHKVPKPSGVVNLVNVYGSGGNAASWGSPNKKLSDEFKKIIEEHGTETDNTDVHVFYVYEMGLESGVALNGVLRGAAPAKTHLGSTQSGYENNILISGRDTGIFTAAHELGHLVLTTNVKSSTGTITHLAQTEFRNIMVKSPVHTDDIKGSKRFDEYQRTRILTNPGGILK